MVTARDPVNRSYLLNQGRLAWWLALPHSSGGGTFHDLMGLSPGALTSMGNSSNGWQATARPGGFAQVLFDGTAGNVYAPIPFPGPAASTAFALATWANFSSTSGTRCAVSIGSTDTLNSAVSIGLRSATIRAENGGGTVLADSGLGPTAGAWYRIVLTANGASCAIGINGLVLGTGTTAPISTTPAFATIGEYLAGGAFDSFAGAEDDTSGWVANPLASSSPDGFMALDYDQSRRGYPDALNYS
jgi:hypothetical protein